MFEIFFTILTFGLIANFIANLYFLIRMLRENVEIEKIIIAHILFFILFAMYFVYSIYFYDEIFVITLLRFFSYIFVFNILFLILKIFILIARKATKIL